MSMSKQDKTTQWKFRHSLCVLIKGANVGLAWAWSTREV